MTKKEMMIKAHEMVKEIKREYPEIDYQFQLGLCLTYLHQENKEGNKMTTEEKLISLGYKVWKKENVKRIYINNVMELAQKLNIELINPKMLKKVSMYYDCLNKKFYFDCSNSRKEIVLKIIESIQNE